MGCLLSKLQYKLNINITKTGKTKTLDCFNWHNQEDSKSSYFIVWCLTLLWIRTENLGNAVSFYHFVSGYSLI